MEERCVAIASGGRALMAGAAKRFRITFLPTIFLAVLIAAVSIDPVVRLTGDAGAITPTFATPNVLVDDSAAFVQQPKIAADNAGKLHAIWLDRRATNDDVYYANSTDGGLTWSLPAARVDNSPAGVVASMA
ncbi:MAG TPA: hypothetical protein VJ397_08175, partial [Thermoplasmata archaeon]|nr:hypothetical protein [Thermoplasmata archaeon]